MGILKIAIVDETGNEIAHVNGNTQLLNVVLPTDHSESWHCLGYIDPYGDTVFNRLQIPRLRIEWNSIVDTLTDLGSNEVARQVRDLIERASLEPHQYIKFYGD